MIASMGGIAAIAALFIVLAFDKLERR
jgi:hypothetical protein